ncbi:MAG: glycine cleavage system protein R [Pseudomonadales bacterium]
MNSSIVLTFIVDDQPGRVELLSHTVVRHHGNWLESRMSCLAGKFAGIARIQIPESELEALTRALHALQEQGFTIVVEKSSVVAPLTKQQALSITIVGQDRPGIVHEISQALAQHQVNVTELHSDVTSAPMSGEPLFEATADANVPKELDLDELNAELEAVANELNIEISLAIPDEQ